MSGTARSTAALVAAVVASAACDVRRGPASDRPLPPPPPPAEPTGPTPLPAGRVPTTPEIAHLTLSVADGATADSVALRRGRFAGLVGKDSVVAELLAAGGGALADTGRAATGDLDGDGSVESTPVLAVRRNGSLTQRLVVVGGRHGVLGELASTPLGATIGVSQVALIGTRDGADVRLTLVAPKGAAEVRWYRFAPSRTSGAKLRMLADTVGGAARPLMPDPVPAAAGAGAAGHHP